MDGPAEQQALFMRLLHDAAHQAETLLAVPDGAVRVRALCRDGLSEIERRAQSPFVEDQLIAIALRRTGGAHRDQSLLAGLKDHFRRPASAFAIEAQRRAIWSGSGNGLPFELATVSAATLEGRLKASGNRLCAELSSHAALYADLWCDPRIDASLSARRTMLAMVTLLCARRDVLRGQSNAFDTVAAMRGSAEPGVNSDGRGPD